MNQSSLPQSLRLRWEIIIVLALTFGSSALRALLQLIAALRDTAPLNTQKVILTQQLSDAWWLELGLQVASAATLFAYGALAIYLLSNDGIRLAPYRCKDIYLGIGFAALIGIPGLALYLYALHTGWTREILPSTSGNPLTGFPTLLLWSAANAFGEELIVVMWLMTRLRTLGWSVPASIAASSVLRGAYHLYQGISAGFGNIAMGIIFCIYFHKTQRIWPLIIAHFIINAIAFLGAPLLGMLSETHFTPLS
ncbi:MAG: CPBP family intramembrane glutamic endopeptidase [Corynebacterium sp.]|nr:CPBP family intramembrane glutamic endopeptidase [Corynebacterium sp.]